MQKIIGLKVDLRDFSNALAFEFYNCVKDLISNKKLLELDNFTQHIKTSRLQHSINVAYYSFIVCKFFGLDYKSAARAGLLHDFYLYDWREQKQPEGYHAKAHPIIAKRNAQTITNLNKIEENCILRHMCPLTPIPPKYAESIILSIIDKYCASFEVIMNLFDKK
jgi:Predicted HD superfamily hydrolase